MTIPLELIVTWPLAWNLSVLPSLPVPSMWNVPLPTNMPLALTLPPFQSVNRPVKVTPLTWTRTKVPVEVEVKCIPPDVSLLKWTTRLAVKVTVPFTPVHGFVTGKDAVT